METFEGGNKGKFRLNKIFNATIFLYFMVLGCTYQNVPWNNYQGFRIYAKTVKCKNIFALNILFNRNFRLKIIYLMFLV